MLIISWLVTWISCFIVPIFSARILGIFPFSSKSHFAFSEAIMRSLALAGHQVTIIAPFELPYSSYNMTLINCKDGNSTPGVTLAQITDSWLSIVTHAIELEEEDCYRVMSMEKVQALENFDAVFVDALPMVQCYMPIVKKLGVPVIATSSHRSLAYTDYYIGNPRIPAVIPTEGIFIHGQSTFYKRLLYFVEEILWRITFIIEDKKVKKFYQNLFPGQDPIDFKFSLLFINHFANLEPRPMVPNAVSIPGIHVKLTQLNPLPEPLKTFIEEATDGVILLSLGSIVSFESKDDKKLNALKNSFAKIPQRIIWSIKGPIDGLPKNVWISDWLPQKEILAHKNVLAFISHCGLNGVYEAIYFGKPVIPLPYFGDQINNAGILATLGVAPRFNYAEHTEENLLKAINDVIKDKKYRENMELLSRKFRDELNSPAEQVVYWTEYVLRYNGSSDLTYEAVGMPWYQYLLLDVIVFIIVIIVIIAFPLHLFIKYTVKKIFYSIKTNVHSKYLNKKEN